MKAHSILSGASCALLALTGVLTGFQGLAQKPFEQEYLIRFSTTVSLLQQKFIYEGLRSQDPDALVWINPNEQNTLVRVHTPLDKNLLQASVDPSGLVIDYLGPVHGDQQQLKSVLESSEQELPQYKDTGDHGNDNARYETVKKAWIETHPVQYDQLNQPH